MTFLIEHIKKRGNIKTFVEAGKINDESLSGSDYEKISSVTLLVHTGYLTIKKEKFIDDEWIYTIDFPNMEIKRLFLTSLVEGNTDTESDKVSNIKSNILKEMRSKDSKGLGETLRELFAHIPYDLHRGMKQKGKCIQIKEG
ncbi:MAG: hypothetical protein LBU10_01875 [Endomicrobium sp.]|jgi:hypothetical protein|nr:hypothetical protein [Endomicrobium sp.]